MTRVQFDEPDLHADTDAGGEMCVVASNGSNRASLSLSVTCRDELTPSLVASQVAIAFRINPTCAICSRTIGSVEDASYLSTMQRVAHTDPCLAQYLVNRFGFRLGGYSSPAERLSAAAAGEDLDAETRDLYHAIDHAYSDPGYTAVIAPHVMCTAQRGQFLQRARFAIAGKPEVLVLDMSETGYADASGISAMVQVHHLYRATVPRGRLYIVGLNDAMRELLRLTAVETLFTIVDSLAEVGELPVG